MINRFSRQTIWFLFVLTFAVSGCQRQPESDVDVLAYGPDVNEIVVTNDYTPRAIAAAGGYQIWIKAKNIQLDGVVTFYKSDGSFYLTEHHYEVYPWSNSILISAYEPQGKLAWQLTGNNFSILEGTKQVDLPNALEKRCFAEAIRNIVTAPVRLLESKVVFTEKLKPVKIGGLWYYPIEWTASDVNSDVAGYVKPSWSKIVFYQNKDSSLVDMIWFANVSGEKFLAVRGYDYRMVEEKGVLIPSRIEIFRTDFRAVLQERLVKVDIY
jgi:hypothetical protein